MYKVKFDFEFGGKSVRVVAKAKDVDSYGAIGLMIKFLDSDNNPIDLPPVEKYMNEIETTAGELLYDKKYSEELSFKE